MDPDKLERRCPRLGGDVAFGYCKVCGEEKTPCHKVFDCWWERFDVVAHMKACLSPEAFDALCASRPQPKMASLVDLIRQAQERASKP
ncbi:MAG: hypothetical protein HGJ94_11470 [Desulfosarcina sp.]|nr:hypothetical protein [Desulfosarcina sp.]MBC2745277.1 hypothetical protein [Desulfosarcina sp.]MBC2768184.1 hypothetical protein [Desulfosarcina sp.]